VSRVRSLCQSCRAFGVRVPFGVILGGRRVVGVAAMLGHIQGLAPLPTAPLPGAFSTPGFC